MLTENILGLWCATIEQAINDAKGLISRGIIVDWKVTDKLRGFDVLNYYDSRAKVQELIDYFLDGSLDACLTEAGVQATAKDVINRIENELEARGHIRRRRHV